MKFGVWRDKRVKRRLIVFATMIFIVLIALHPELRLLVPVVDVLGIDVFLAVVALQSWAFVKLLAEGAYSRVLLPFGEVVYRGLLFLFGYMGPYVEATISCRQLRNRL